MSPGKHNPINKKLTKEEVLGMMSADETEAKNEPATNIIETNNLKSEASLGGAAQKFGGFFTKQAIKQGLKKYVGPMVSKAFGVTTALLTPTNAYGGQLDQTGHWENELKRGNSSAAKEYFFNDQYKNFDSQSEYQQDRLKRLNQKYDLGYSQKSLQSFKDVKPDEM